VIVNVISFHEPYLFCCSMFLEIFGNFSHKCIHYATAAIDNG
jgi:hypothetical protein